MNIERSSRNIFIAAVFDEKFDCTMRELFKKSAVEKNDNNWVEGLPTITKQYKNRKQTSTKLAPIQVSSKLIEGKNVQNL